MHQFITQSVRTLPRHSSAFARCFKKEPPSTVGTISGLLSNKTHNHTCINSIITTSAAFSSCSVSQSSPRQPHPPTAAAAAVSTTNQNQTAASSTSTDRQPVIHTTYTFSPKLANPPASITPFAYTTASHRQNVALGKRRILHSAMYGHRATVALVSALVGYGAYYSYNGEDHMSITQFRNMVSSANSGAFAGLGLGLTNTATAQDSTPTRHVLIIGADQLSTGTFVGEGPITKQTQDRKQVVEMLTPEQTDEKLRSMEQSYFVNRGEGVVRYDLVQMPSNNPIEDDHAEKIVRVPSVGPEGHDWMFWGVFDGHSGWTTSAKLRQQLILTVARELNNTYQAAPQNLPTNDQIDQAIKDGFLRLDDEIVIKSVEKVFEKDSKVAAAEILAPALSGSCALLSFFDSRTGLLRVACTGDSRAILGRRNKDGLWTATALSADQTGSNPDEEARLRKLHPNEPRVIYAGRVLGGLEPTRAFGDASYKWTAATIQRLKSKFFARSASPLSRTPPYVTAEPVVTTAHVKPEAGDFMVMATDGLWEMLTNEEVVGLVGKWIDTNGAAAPGAAGPTSRSVWQRIFGSDKNKLAIDRSNAEALADGSKTPVRVAQWGLTPGDEQRFTVKDKNVATHLVRNALGGNKAEQVSALLTLPSPFSRRYRDDLTVQVVFFGKDENGRFDKTDGIVVNIDATTLLKEKAKL